MSRTLITAEWLSPLGGSERVVEHLAATLPDARVFAPVVFADGAPSIDRSRIGAAFRRPERLMARREAAAAMNAATWPTWGRTLDRRADLVIASHHMSSHWTACYSDVPHVAYVHTPARYAWFPELDDRASGSLPARVLGAHIRRMDRRAAPRVRAYAANSEATRQRIQQVWHRDATVIYPPTDLSRFDHVTAREGVEPFLLGLSRFIPYKRVDYVVDVAEAAGLPAVLVGRGHLEPQLRERAERASVPVRVVTDASDEQVAQLMADAAALVYPAVEDFGLVPVEAMAAGTPVLALDEAGTKETVLPGVSGALLPELDARAWADRVAEVMALDADGVRKRAADFGVPAFAEAIRGWVAQHS
ncbi:glycosyltransferase [Nocardioides acrostichi]|uniref:Glycosyltransferase n=1 Tax=Nocardioides acrostichi TaxID=2784339 RepID=A0A930YBJ5_9ACTN|nr:glycosyltransferase [Nocardioides acrostichi]MBF4162533.1 glycosyltransferase [Nocardioides acrostichi]